MAKVKWICLVLCVCVGVGVYIFAEDGSAAKDSAVSMPKLLAMDEEARSKVVEKLRYDHIHLQQQLIDQLAPSNPKEVNFSIAYILGVYRCREAVSELNKYISLEADAQSIANREPRWQGYPVANALIQIGDPAVPEMLWNIETNSNELVRKLSVDVIRIVLGPDAARAVLAKGGEGKADAVKVNFKTALEYFDSELARIAPKDPKIEAQIKQKLSEIHGILTSSQPASSKEKEAKIEKLLQEIKALEAVSASQPASQPTK